MFLNILLLPYFNRGLIWPLFRRLDFGFQPWGCWTPSTQPGNGTGWLALHNLKR
jgi:hypothetical protein